MPPWRMEPPGEGVGERVCVSFADGCVDRCVDRCVDKCVDGCVWLKVCRGVKEGRGLTLVASVDVNHLLLLCGYAGHVSWYILERHDYY